MSIIEQPFQFSLQSIPPICRILNMQWKQQIIRLLQIIGGYPNFSSEFKPDLVIGLICAVITCFAVYHAVAKALKCPATESNRIVISLVIGLLLGVGTAAALNIYVVPKVHNDALALAIPIIGVVIVILVLITPVSMLLIKGKYFQNLSSIVLAILASMVVVFMVKGAAAAVRQGGKSVEAVKERKIEEREGQN